MGPLGHQVRSRLGDGSRYGIALEYVECPDPDIGLARGILLCRGLFPEPFVTVLGDELYADSNHSRLAQGEPGVLPFYLEGTYFNINTIDDYNYAQLIMRSAGFGQRKISLVIPAYNEERSIAYVVRDLLKGAHEVFVVDNSSSDRTAEVARQAGRAWKRSG